MRHLFLTLAAFSALSIHAQHRPDEEEPYEMRVLCGSDKPAESKPLAFSFMEARADATVRHSEKFLVRIGTEYFYEEERGLFHAGAMFGYRRDIGRNFRSEVFAGPAYQRGFTHLVDPSTASDEDYEGPRHEAIASHVQIRLVYRCRYWISGRIIESRLHSYLHAEVGIKLGRKREWRAYIAHNSLFESAIGLRLHLNVLKHKIFFEPGLAVTSGSPHPENLGGLCSVTAGVNL